MTLKVIDEREISALLSKAERGALGKEDFGLMVQWTRRWLELKPLLENKNTSFKEVKRLLLGPEPEDEKKKKADNPSGRQDPPKSKPVIEKRKGHGRRGSDEYSGCRRVNVFPPPHFRQEGECPGCVGDHKGRLRFYKPSRPLKRLRLTGGAPIKGTVYYGFPLACSKCGAQYAPEWPEDAKGSTYDASARAMIILMRHWYGFPAYRLEKLQAELGIPVPDGTQADLIKEATDSVEPVFYALFKQAALADQFIVDDTSARIQKLISERKRNKDLKRYAAHVTGIIARSSENDIYLYRIGSQHAGENLEDLLKHRPAGKNPPLQMSDALAANTDHPFETTVAYCLNHARGNFVDVQDSFPVECQEVLARFSEIFKNEAETKKQQMNAQERLHFHQQHSARPTTELFAYLRRLLDMDLVEPASGMAAAARYMLKREEELTRFLKIPGAPLDSNAVERALKHAVLIRKNSLFYHNEVTAYQAGVFMSLAATAAHNGVDPHHYLTALLDNESAVQREPEAWLPWNYQAEGRPSHESAARFFARPGPSRPILGHRSIAESGAPGQSKHTSTLPATISVARA